jgi:translation initiation factor IF-3
MIRKKPFQRQQQQPRITANNNIRFPELRVLSDIGEMVGVMPTREAMQIAHDQGKDLVLVAENAQPPIAKIIDLAKYRYQMQQKKAEGRKKAKVLDMKEIRLTPFMGEGDFQSRLKKIVGFLEKGHKVRLTLEFRGREITKQEFGREQFQRVFDATQEIASLEIEPKMLGKKLLAQLMPVKKK